MTMSPQSLPSVDYQNAEFLCNYSDITPFSQRVYYYTSLIPKGKVSTYKEIAQAILKERGEQGGVQGRLCQAVGNSLARNPFPKHLVPCHRVIPSSGIITGYHGKRTLEAITERLNILQCEGVDLFELQSVKSGQQRLELLKIYITRFV